MKNIKSIAALRIALRSASGLAVLALTKDEWKRYQIGRGIRVTHTFYGLGQWLPLSQVVVKDGEVVAASDWLIRKKGLERAEVGAW